jgi:hypothetical protein
VTSTLTLRLTWPGEPEAVHDWFVLDDGNRVGRIRYATESSSRDKWFWCINLPYFTVPANRQGWAPTLDDAKVRFKAAWEPYKAGLPAGELAAVWASDPVNR